MAASSKKTGLSLYANLLEPDKQSGATISGAPVRYDTKRAGADDADAQKRKDASSPDKQTPNTSTPSQQPSVQRSNFEDWVGDEDEDYFFDNKPKPERGGRNKKKKRGGKQQQEAVRTWSWDDIYDPSMPNNYADYKGSDEQIMEIRDWKARLYYHQLKGAKKNGAARSAEADKKPATNSMFAPPASLSFAPPSFDDRPSRPPHTHDDDDYYPPSAPSRPPDTSDSYEPPLVFSHAAISDKATNEDTYSRRMQHNSADVPQPSIPPPLMPPPQMQPPPPSSATTVPPPPVNESIAAAIAVKKAEAAAKIAAFKAKVEAHKAAKIGNGAAMASPAPPLETATPPACAYQPPAGDPPQALPPPPPPAPTEQEEPGATISRAPVRYHLPPAPENMPVTEEDAASTPPTEDEIRSNRPGQKGFAERLLKKYGWEKGKGLGAQGNEGITTAVVAKAEKRKKFADAEGGGWAKPANMGKLVGGKRRKVEGGDGKVSDGEDGGRTEDQPYGPLAPVIKLGNMLTGLDIDDEIENKDLYGEIGREMETQYGKVERVFIWREAMGGGNEVFVKFVSPLSALRAVGACDGMEFAGNVVGARFWEDERFEGGEYA
ncbi:hypothetical protein B0A55_03658 [Friedmanniomyces simplex]|uniref:G-patch domain-containing protein n=1 Tax=Friedmanniomyces simplex TaxID=329884 RepID=A0A4U0XVP2_9PEZI|nr:hypothetical protein B0A55_03658 [Friedmanniomyces simplex]